MLSIGLLGAGSHSRTFHGPALKIVHDELPGEVELAAVCDIDRAKARSYAREFGFVRVYDDLETMLASERLDGIVAVTPMERTLEIASRILRAKVPVVIEKPPGLDVGEGRRLLAVARETGTPHMVSMNRRFCPAVVRARQWLADQAKRPPRLIVARMLRHKRREAGFVAQTGIHLVDAVCSFLGRPCEVVARRVATGDPDSHLYQGTLTFDSGAAAELVFASAVGFHEETYEILGEDYRILIDALAAGVTIHDARQEVLNWRVPADSPPVDANGTLDETRAFVESLRGRRPFEPALEDAVASFAAAEAIQAAEPVEQRH